MALSIKDAYNSGELLRDGVHHYKSLSLDEYNQARFCPAAPIYVSSLKWTLSPVINTGYNNTIEVIVDDRKVIDSVRLKELNEEKHFSMPIKVEKELVVSFDLKKMKGVKIALDISYYERCKNEFTKIHC